MSAGVQFFVKRFPISRVELTGSFLCLPGIGEDVVPSNAFGFILEGGKFSDCCFPLQLFSIVGPDCCKGAMKFRHAGVDPVCFAL